MNEKFLKNKFVLAGSHSGKNENKFEQKATVKWVLEKSKECAELA
jgi:hypothetical protein